jgi:hypothetical protein
MKELGPKGHQRSRERGHNPWPNIVSLTSCEATVSVIVRLESRVVRMTQRSVERLDRYRVNERMKANFSSEKKRVIVSK